MASYQSLPNGSRVLVVRDPATGLVQQIGAAQLPNGNVCRCNNTTQGWVRSDRMGCNYKAISPKDAASIASQMANGAAARGNTFSNVYEPNVGAVGLSERRGNRSPVSGMGLVFSLILDNTAGGGTPAIARKFIGDATGTYALLGNTEVTPTGFVVGGSWGANSLSQAIALMYSRPWSVDKIQFISGGTNPNTYFNLANNYYFDTKPTPNAPVKDSLVLTNLLNNDQYLPNIQWLNEEMTFDGRNGLDIQVPIAQSITLQFTISAERSAGDQVAWS